VTQPFIAPAHLSAALADRYRIERELGAGGMATVYLAMDLKHDRNVAIKILKPELAAVLGADRFVVEIKTTAALQHPHILPLFDSGEADGFLYYVMPYIEGETIREKLNRETQFGIDEAVRITREVADALDYAHRHGVIHRDIKPENILLHDGRAMVMDFGIALAVSAAAGGRMTETGLSLGTPHYMSPEQATADKLITARSDVYSLGSVLYEMLAGEPPHVGGSAQAVIMKIITDTARPVNQLRRSVPGHVAAAVAKAIEKVPADRFESAKAFGDALVNPSFSTATINAGKTGGDATGRWPRLFVAAATVAALATTAAVWGWSRAEKPELVTRLSIALPDSQSLAPFTNFDRLAISPDGRMIAYSSAGAAEGQDGPIMLRRFDELRGTPLAGTEGGVNPSFSPDGKSLAFFTPSPRAIRTVSIAGGPTRVVADSLVDLGGVSWGADGYIYYDGHLAGDGLARVRETGGRPEPASMPDAKGGERYHQTPSALPNGRGVLMTIVRARDGIITRDVAVVDTRTGKHTVLVHAVAATYAKSGHLLYVTNEGTLMAVSFDARKLRITGDAIPLATGVGVLGARVGIGVASDGSLVYLAGAAANASKELVWVARDGKATPVDTTFRKSFSSRVRLSPDGRYAAVTADERSGARAVWVKQLDRGAPQKMADGSAPTWSPDGKTLLMTAPSGPVTVPTDGSRLPVQIHLGTTLPAASPEYSPDGKWIVFQYGSALAATPIGGDTTTRDLVADGKSNRSPTLSPDGRWLAYASDESGRAEVFVRPFPDTKLAKRQVSTGGGLQPRWSRDGRELFFVDDASAMIAVPVIPGAAFSTGEPKRLFNAVAYTVRTTSFDVAPDGRFLMVRQIGAGGPKADELILVQNVFEELKAKVKPK